LIGIILARLISFIFPLHILSLEIYHTHAGIVVLAFLSIYVVFVYNKYAWVIPLVIGFVFDGFIFLIIKADYSYWSMLSIFGAFSFILFFSVLASYNLQSKNILDTSKNKNSILFFIISSIFTITIYRGLNYTLLFFDVPNEERSTFIMGYEIRHICYGILVCAFISILKWVRVRYKGMYAIESSILGFGIASIADQFIYSMLPVASDDAYFSMTSLVGGIVVTLIYLAFAIYFATIQHENGCIPKK